MLYSPRCAVGANLAFVAGFGSKTHWSGNFLPGDGDMLRAKRVFGGRRSMWWLKRYFLPYLYRDLMLKGHEWDIPYRVRASAEARVPQTHA